MVWLPSVYRFSAIMPHVHGKVIRYDTVGAGPLWSSSIGIPGETDIPPCERCGKPRRFEFQVRHY